MYEAKQCELQRTRNDEDREDQRRGWRPESPEHADRLVNPIET
jgi:hypothetical protein